jgi:hypothetical protein
MTEVVAVLAQVPFVNEYVTVYVPGFEPTRSISPDAALMINPAVDE